jgi:RNA exonuclease 1
LPVDADHFSVKEKLGIFIQDRTADLGHSSAEDAKAALDLLKWRVRDDKDD